eukprot:m.12231 g.12231  ORF g.12231 m.12231 type:complete len:58 (+) comp4620_c0_seq1:1787-1960(+)
MLCKASSASAACRKAKCIGTEAVAKASPASFQPPYKEAVGDANTDTTINDNMLVQYF